MAWDRPEASVRISRIRRFVRQRLDAERRSAEDEMLRISDAQLLIARSYGFNTWQELESEATRKSD
jgi:hypothetical protein